MTHYLRALCADERGATGIEYGFLASLVVLAMVSGVQKLGNAVEDMFTHVEDEYAEATG